MRIVEHPVVVRIKPEIERTLIDFGYELVQMKLGGRSHNQTLTLLIDKPGGVTSGDCKYVAKRISLLLDILDPIQGGYKMIVSSPGVDRPLTRDADFARFAGQQASIRFTNVQGKRQSLTGILVGVENAAVKLQVSEGTLEILLADVESAHLVYDWDQDSGNSGE